MSKAGDSSNPTLPAPVDGAAGHDNVREAYSKVYENNHLLRERIFKVTSSVVAIMVIADSWAISHAAEAPLPDEVRVALIIGITTILVIGAGTTNMLWREFKQSAQMIVRLECAMGFYEGNQYLADTTLYPLEAARWGLDLRSAHLCWAPPLLMAVFAAASLALQCVVN